MSSCLAGREWILLSSLSHHVLCRRHVELTGRCSTRGQVPIPNPPDSSLPGPPSPPSNPQSTTPQKDTEGRPLPTFPGALRWSALTLTLPNHKLPLSLPPAERAVPKACERGDVLRGGLNRELVSGNGAPPCILPAPSPKEAHAPSQGQRPSPSRGWGVGEEELRAPLGMEARPGMRLTLKSRSIRRIGGCGVYKNLGGLGLDERDDLLGEGQVLLG